MRVRDRIMSGAYDWIIFPAALAFLALIAAGLWQEFGPNGRRGMEKTLTCEQAALAGGYRDRLIACDIAPVAHR